jgi:hypothetical protein
MAVGEKRSTWVISQVSWTDWTAQDVYYWQEHSFQYAANINCDDELHGIKLSNKAEFISWFCPKSQLVSCGSNGVMALRVDWYAKPKIFTTFWQSTDKWDDASPNTNVKVCPWVIFQDKFWYGITLGWTNGALCAINNVWTWTLEMYKPQDHTDYTDEEISTPTPQWQLYMDWAVSAILNYNNTRLVVAVWWGSSAASIWVYYPELDNRWQYSSIYGQTWWKKVLEYEAWVEIVAMTCTFEYLKIWAVDEWWNTKIYYYQGNNNLRSTFVYNVVDLTGERVLRAYSINGTDYYITSIDWTDGLVNLNKMVGNTPINLLQQRAWLDPLDVNYKDPYFVWPVSLNAAYKSGRFYIGDQYWVFQFTQNQQGYDKWYMKWHLRDYTTKSGQPVQVYWLCENQWFLYISDSEGCWKIRIYDTGKDWYNNTYQWVLISREYEGKEWWTITKMLDEVRLNYELNPLTNNKWTIDVYVSPNNLWKNTHTFTEANNWYHVMHIDNTNGWTRTEKSNLFNDLGSGSSSSFKFDWQTITYAIVIKQTTSTHATPIVRQIDIRYHTKDKVNNVYDIN